MNMEDFSNKFVGMMRYVPDLKHGKIKIQWFLSCLPYPYRDRIEYDEPSTLDETIIKVKYCYEQHKNKTKHLKSWKEKKKEKLEQQKTGFKPPHYKNQSKSY